MMNQMSKDQFAELGLQDTVYIRAISAEEALAQLGENAQDFNTDAEVIFAVHAANGSPLALLDNRDAAFAAARTYNMEPVSVH